MVKYYIQSLDVYVFIKLLNIRIVYNSADVSFSYFEMIHEENEGEQNKISRLSVYRVIHKREE